MLEMNILQYEFNMFYINVSITVSIARLLKKADTLKTEVCGERGALQEWRAQLERNAGDITAIEQFTKQDVSKAKVLIGGIRKNHFDIACSLYFSSNVHNISFSVLGIRI